MTHYRLNKEAEAAVYSWIKNLVGTKVTVLWSKQSAYDPLNAPRPDLPFIELNIISVSQLGKSEEIHVNDDTYRYNFRKKFTLTVNAYSNETPMTYIETIINSLQLEDSLNILRAGGIAANGEPIINDISGIMESKYELRASCDVFLCYNKSQDIKLGAIETVIINKNQNSEITIP
jgi:hypothetical protein